MELHSIKEKKSKSRLTGGCSLNGQMANEVINTESAKRFVESGRVLCMILVS